MRAMVFEGVGKPLKMQEVEKPSPENNQILIKVKACGVCRTDLHIIYGELDEPKLPLILGHQVVGVVEEVHPSVTKFKPGMRVGVPWLGGSCNACSYCDKGQENLCDKALYTGYQMNGGFAEYCTANADYCFPLPENYPDIQVAPLLCAGLIGYRAYRMLGDAQKLGFYGFGSSAHILTQLAIYEGRQVYAFTKQGDKEGQDFARSLGAVWASDSFEEPLPKLDGAIIFAPVGKLVPQALKVVRKGATVVCAGIHMSDIPSFPYDLLWGERVLRSVANLTRKDGEEFLEIAPNVPIKTEVTTYPLEEANQALDDLYQGKVVGSVVLKI